MYEKHTNRQDDIGIDDHTKQIELIKADALEVRAGKNKPVLSLLLHSPGELHGRRRRSALDGSGHSGSGGGGQNLGIGRGLQDNGMRRLDSGDWRKLAA